jgi:hypothetical protein
MPVEGPDLTHRFVVAELARGKQNIAALQQVVDAQRDVHDRVMSKAHGGGLDDARPSSRAEATRFRNNAACNDVAYSYCDIPLVTQKGMFNASRMLNGCDVANNIAHAQVRQEKFQRRKRQCINEEIKRNEALKVAHEEADRRVVLRQHEMIERQDMRTSAAQQKRGEQKKMLIEIQKFQGQEFEKLQLKHHPHAVSAERATPNAKRREGEKASPEKTLRPSTSPASASSLGLDAKVGAASESVFKDVMQSHKGYVNTLTKWHGFVAENEKRTDAYWHKMCQGGDPKKQKRKDSKQGAIGLKKTVKDMVCVRKLLSKSSTSPDLLGDYPLGGSAIDPDGDWNVEGFSAPTSHNTSQVLRSSPVSPDVYAARLERVKSHHMDLEQKANEKLERDKQYLEEKRRMGKNEMDKRAGLASEYNNAWQDRNDTASRRRNQQNNDGEMQMERKLTDFANKKSSMDAARSEDLRLVSEDKRDKATMTKDAAQFVLDDTADRHKAKQKDKDERGAALLEIRRENNHVASDSGIREKAAAMLAQKEKNEKAFKRSTTQDIDRKLKRSDTAKYLNNKPSTPMEAFERHRHLRKQRGDTMRSTPLHLTLTGIDMPDDIQFDQLGASYDSADSGWQSPDRSPSNLDRSPTLRMERSPTVSLDQSPSLRGSPGPMDRQLSLGTPSGRQRADTASTLGHSSTKQPFDESPKRHGGDASRHPSITESEDAHEDEASFLADLEECAQRWLKDLTKDSE